MQLTASFTAGIRTLLDEFNKMSMKQKGSQTSMAPKATKRGFGEQKDALSRRVDTVVLKHNELKGKRHLRPSEMTRAKASAKLTVQGDRTKEQAHKMAQEPLKKRRRECHQDSQVSYTTCH